MAKPRFLLRNPKNGSQLKHEDVPVILKWTYRKNVKRYYRTLPIETAPINWDFKHQESDADNDTNKVIRKIKLSLEQLKTKCFIDQEPLTEAKIDRVVDECIDPTDATKFSVYAQRNAKTREQLTAINALLDYEKTYKVITRDGLTQEMYNEMTNYFLKERIHNRGSGVGHTVQTVRDYMQYIDTWMEDWTDQLNIRFKGFKRPSKIKSVPVNFEVYCTPAELLAIEHADITRGITGRLVKAEGLKTKEAVRHYMLIMSGTGLRSVDAKAIGPANKEEIDGVVYIRRTPQKTAGKVRQRLIPCNPQVLRSLDKYGWQLPSLPAGSAVAKHVRAIAYNAGLHQLVEHGVWKAGKYEITHVPKWQRIKPHTGRRSFATNGVLAGVPHSDLMACGGWKSLQSFMKYVCATPEQSAELIAKHSFFSHT